MSTRDKKRVISWDTAIFLAWIMDESRLWGNEIMDGIEQTLEDAYSNKIELITSVVTRGEILDATLDDQQRSKFNSIFNGGIIKLADVDRRIIDKAAVIRNHYKTSSDATISLADSIHLATAIHYNVSEFVTLDGGGKRSRKRDLLRLSGDVAGISLRIVKPKFVPPPAPLEGPTPESLSAVQLNLLSADDREAGPRDSMEE